MELVDTHCHLYLNDFESDREETMARAVAAGLIRCYLPSIDSTHFSALLTMESKYPDRCRAMAGLHPCSVRENYKAELAYFQEQLTRRKFSAIGEIGLDFYWDRSFENQQYEAFREQISWAIEFKMPIVIHSRNSMKESIKTVREAQNGSLTGVFHCFGDGPEAAKEIIGLGFFLGIGGIITYKNSTLPDTLRDIDLKHIVLETDAPYLTPAPFRGKRNESAYLTYIASKLAEIKGVPVEALAQITSENARKLFGT